MIPCLPTALAIVLVTVPVAAVSAQDSDPGGFATGGGITLRMEYSSGYICELSTEVRLSKASEGPRSVALSCNGRHASRTLTTQEANDFLRLARSAQLYRARGIGRDGRGGDGWLATMRVTDGGMIVILVVSGNPEFASGPRRELSNFLQKLFTELTPALDSSKRR